MILDIAEKLILKDPDVLIFATIAQRFWYFSGVTAKSNMKGKKRIVFKIHNIFHNTITILRILHSQTALLYMLSYMQNKKEKNARHLSEGSRKDEWWSLCSFFFTFSCL